ncbi:MAG: ferrous iron transporter B, partial [Anaerotignum sp.]|nr:ferrous iron transporter B [Anaerotignum sp.]
FLQREFTVIFVATVIIWFLQSFDSRLNVVTDSADSLLAMIGQWLAPLFAPLGFDDWRVPTALITGFTAKEAVVSTLGVLLGTSMEGLEVALGTLFTPVSAISFLVFTLLYTPCMAAVAAVKRELESGFLAACVALMQCVVAWIVSFGVYQVLNLFF